MVMVITGNDDTFDDLVFGKPTRGTMDRLKHYRDSFDDRCGDLIGAARDFITREAGSVYRRFDESEAMRRIRASHRKMNNVWVTNGIVQLRTIGEFQNAKPQMRRYMMAEPTTRRRFIEQRCEGYGDRYQDLEPGLIGRDHYDYRRATNGMFVRQPNGKYSPTTYHEDLREGDEEPLFVERCDILDSWDALQGHMAAGKEDPLSPTNMSL